MDSIYSCILVDDEYQAIELLSDAIKAFHKNLEIKATYGSWLKAMEGLRENKCDILFLDISINGRNSFDLLKSIPPSDCEVIFITAHSEYTLEAIKQSAAGYLVKPFDELELADAVDRAIKKINLKRTTVVANAATLPAKIGIPNAKGIDFVEVNTIICLESMNHCTLVTTLDTQIISSYSLTRFMAILGKSTFFQTHRSYVINLNYIKRYLIAGVIVMSNNAEIPLSKNQREEFLKIFSKVSKNDLEE